MKPKEQLIKWLLLMFFISNYVKSEYFTSEKQDDFRAISTDKRWTNDVSLKIQSPEENNDNSINGLKINDGFRFRTATRNKLSGGRLGFNRIEVSLRSVLQLERFRRSLKSDSERRLDATRKTEDISEVIPKSIARHGDFARSLNSRRYLRDLQMEIKRTGQRYSTNVAEMKSIQSIRSQDLTRNAVVRSPLMKKSIAENFRIQHVQKINPADDMTRSSSAVIRVSKLLGQGYVPGENNRRMVRSQLRYVEKNDKPEYRVGFYKIKLNRERKLERKIFSKEQKRNRIHSEKFSRGEHRNFRELLNEKVPIPNKGLFVGRKILGQQSISPEISFEVLFDRRIRLKRQRHDSSRREQDLRVRIQAKRDESFRTFQQSRGNRMTNRNEERTLENQRQNSNHRERNARETYRMRSVEKSPRESVSGHSARQNHRLNFRNDANLETRINAENRKKNPENEIEFTRNGEIVRENRNAYEIRKMKMHFSELSGYRNFPNKNEERARDRRMAIRSERLNRENVALERKQDSRIRHDGKENTNLRLEARTYSFERTRNARRELSSRRSNEQLQGRRQTIIFLRERNSREFNTERNIKGLSLERVRTRINQNDRRERENIHSTEMNRNADRRQSKERERSFSSSQRNRNSHSSNDEVIRDLRSSRERTTALSVQSRNRNSNWGERKTTEPQDKKFGLRKNTLQITVNARTREMGDRRMHEVRASRSNDREAQSRRQDIAILRERNAVVRENQDIHHSMLDERIRESKPINIRSLDRRQEINLHRKADSPRRSVEDLKRYRMILTERNNRLREQISVLKKRSVEERKINSFSGRTQKHTESILRVESKHRVFTGKEAEFYRQRRFIRTHLMERRSKQTGDVHLEVECVRSARNIASRSLESKREKMERNIRQSQGFMRQSGMNVRSLSGRALESREFKGFSRNFRNADERSERERRMLTRQENRAFDKKIVTERSTDGRSRFVISRGSRKIRGNVVRSNGNYELGTDENIVFKENNSRESNTRLQTVEISNVMSHRSKESRKRDTNSMRSLNFERMTTHHQSQERMALHQRQERKTLHQRQERMALHQRQERKTLHQRQERIALKERNRESQTYTGDTRFQSAESRKILFQIRAKTREVADQSVRSSETISTTDKRERSGKILLRNLQNIRKQFTENGTVLSRSHSMESRKTTDITNKSIRTTENKSLSDRREKSMMQERNGRGFRGRIINRERETENTRMQIRDNVESRAGAINRRNSNIQEHRLLSIGKQGLRLLNQRNGRGFRGKVEKELRFSNFHSSLYLKSAEINLIAHSSSHSRVSDRRLNNLISKKISVPRNFAQISFKFMELKPSQHRTNSDTSLTRNVRQIRTGQMFTANLRNHGSIQRLLSGQRLSRSESSSRRGSSRISKLTYQLAESRRNSNTQTDIGQALLSLPKMATRLPIESLVKSQMKSNSAHRGTHSQLSEISEYQRKVIYLNRRANSRTNARLQRSPISSSSSLAELKDASPKGHTVESSQGLRKGQKIPNADDLRFSKQTRRETDGSKEFVFQVRNLANSMTQEYSALGSISMPADNILEKYQSTVRDSSEAARFLENWSTSGRKLATTVLNVILGFLITAAMFRNELQLKSRPFREKIGDVLFLRC